MRAEPGDRAPAPGALRLVQRFVNTNDLEGGPELIPDAAALRDWLVAAELLEPRARVTAGDHTRAIALREALRDLAAANAGLPHDPAAADAVNAAAHRARLAPVFDGTHSDLAPAASGVDAALGQHRRRTPHGRRRGHLAAPEGLRARRLPLGLLRPLQEPLRPLVLDGRLRAAREEPPRLPPPTAGPIEGAQRGIARAP